MLDVIPPSALALLNVSIAAVLGRRLREVEHPALAVVCAVAPALYGLGAVLYLLAGEWLPGLAVGALGTFAVPVAVLFALRADRLARGLAVAAAVGVWCGVWVGAFVQVGARGELPNLPLARAAEVAYAGFLLLPTALIASAAWRADASATARKIAGVCLPLFLLGAGYLLLKPPGAIKPVFSASVHAAAEVVLLLLVAPARDEREATPWSLAVQAGLLAVGALLILLLAANLGLFPKAPGALWVAVLVATGLALAYGSLRPTLDLVLQSAFDPEAARAKRRVRALQEELERARDRLRRAEHSSLVGELAAQVAHEIKNPLGPIKGYTKVIEREAEKAGALNDVIQRGLDVIRQEVEAIDARARGLLELARPAAPQLRDVDYAALGDDVLDLVAGDLPSDVAARWAERPQAAPGRADPLLLRSALVNAVQNAAAAAAAGGGTVELRLAERDGALELLVDDDGPGLPEGDPEALFRPFVSHREGGSGLGLVVARGALRAMGGELTLERREPRGARARFRLPAGDGGAEVSGSPA